MRRALHASGNMFTLRRIRIDLVLAVVMLLVGLGVRLVAVTGPFDSTSTLRTIHGAIVARGMYYQMLPGADPALKSEAIAIWQAESIYEPKIFERLVATAYLLTGGEKLWISRLFATGFWLIGAVFLYDLARRLSGRWGALLSLGVFLLVPIGVQASRWFQPDPLMVMMVIVAADAIFCWSEKPSPSRAVLSGIAAGLAILVKVQSVFPTLGFILGILLSVYGLGRFFLKRDTYFIFIPMVVIPAAYYVFFIGTRSGGYFSFWTLSMLSLLTKGFMYTGWVGILNQLYGLAALAIGLIGIFLTRLPGRGLLAGFWTGYGIFGLTFPFQIHTHAYYSLIVLPVLALSLAPFGELVAQNIRISGPIWRVAAAALVLIGVFYPAWLDRNMVLETQTTDSTRAWEKMGQELPRDGKIIALTHDYGNYLAYYGFRKVDLWPYTEDFQVREYMGSNTGRSFEELFTHLTNGYRYFLVTQFTQLAAQPDLKKMLADHYPVIQDGDGYILYDLNARR